MDRLGIEELHEAVRTFSGISIKDYGGIGGIKTVSIRSLGSHHTAVSYDGVTISNAQGGQVDIGNFSLDNIDVVSLTIGQGEDIFQPARNFASSGILNIISSIPKFDDKRVIVGAELQSGSFGLFNPTLNLATKISDRWSISARGDWMQADGEYPFVLTNGLLITDEIRSNSDIETLRAEMNIYGDVGKSGKVYIKGNYLDSERGLPGSVVLYNKTANERLWDNNGFAQGGYSDEFNEKWAIKGYVKYHYNWSRYIDIKNSYENGMQDDRYTQQEYYASSSVRFTPNKNWAFTFSQDIFNNTLSSNLQDFLEPNRLSSITALAGQFSTPRLTVTTSLLGVYNTESTNEKGKPAPDREHISPSLSGSYQIFKDKNIRIRASVKDSYRVPTFNDLYYARVGNRDLRPEQATQYNLGITYAGDILPQFLDYFSFSLDGYHNEVKDKIIAIPTMFIWKMFNLGEVDIWGADLNVSTYFKAGSNFDFNLSGNYSYQYAVDVTDPDAKSYKHQIPYTPSHSGNIAISCTNKWVEVGYTTSMVGKRYTTAQNLDQSMIEGYFEQNISLSHTFHIKECTLRLQGEVLNIGDVTYDIIKYYPMPGRQYRITLKFNY